MTAGDPRMRITIPNEPTEGDPREDNGQFSERLKINRYCLNRRNDDFEFDRKIVSISLWSLG